MPEVFDRTLFTRDDQIFHVLDGGINAGQHEGGGKSVEIRRFGFNLDHGGVNGGLKVLAGRCPAESRHAGPWSGISRVPETGLAGIDSGSESDQRSFQRRVWRFQRPRSSTHSAAGDHGR